MKLTSVALLLPDQMYGLAREVQTGSDKGFLNANFLAHLIMKQWRAQADNVDHFAYSTTR